jgi:uracil-DNA glycosylase
MQEILQGILPEWEKALRDEFRKDYFCRLLSFLESEVKSGKVVFPRAAAFLEIFKRCDLNQVRVVILGQDPYHGEAQATGLAFAVPNSLQKKPPSLQNILKELQSDLNLSVDTAKSDLGSWVDQGVFLLNTVLSVRKDEAFSHRDKGWECFSDRVVEILNAEQRSLIFILWGAAAQKKKSLLNLERHFVIESAHPSPLSSYRGFFGSKPFSKTNSLLVETLKERPIEWRL